MVASTEGEPSWVVSNLPITKGGDQFKVMHVVFCEKINNILLLSKKQAHRSRKNLYTKKKRKRPQIFGAKDSIKLTNNVFDNKESQPAYNDEIINIYKEIDHDTIISRANK